ncbi:hypothetical protein BC832DRAFT_81985 [Gaertneriomyces semiglobifer]|nr:hypothetical protein BC832DRAFT_81985 [Gaertneriomyces semiglobifer]
MKAQTMPRAKDDTDRELQNYLRMMQMEDQALAMAIEKERERIDSQLEKIHRQSNFRIDEMHIKEANFAEAQVLRDMQETEQKLIEQRQREEADLVKDDERHKRMLDKLLSDLRNLKLGIRQRQTAHERVQAVKKRLAERRSTMQLRIEHTELRQQRERRALQDSHARIIKNMSIYRNLILKDYEDKQLQELIASDTDDAERRRQLEEDRADADRLHEAKMLQLKLRMQKEVEQLREEQLLRLNHLTKMSDLELAQVEAWENMLSEQKMQELELEAEQRREVELVEETMEEQVDQLKAFHSQRVMQIKAARTVALQRHEARQLVRCVIIR